jgi:hypothetical protein
MINGNLGSRFYSGVATLSGRLLRFVLILGWEFREVVD